jgi:hypothetical protein
MFFLKAELTRNNCDDEISIIKRFYHPLETTERLNQFNIHPHNQIIISSPVKKKVMAMVHIFPGFKSQR